MNTGQNKIMFVKSYERDTALMLEQLWARSFARCYEELGARNPFAPTIIEYSTRESMQIWENGKAIRWFQDKLLEKNLEDPAFTERHIERYLFLNAELESYWERGPTADIAALKAYKKLFDEAVSLFSLWYYAGTDDRTPRELREQIMTVRHTDNFFAGNIVFTMSCVEALGGKGEFVNMLTEEEFPNLPSVEILKKRTGVVCVDGEVQPEVSLEAFAQTHPEYEFEGLSAEGPTASELSGQSAQKGIVRGVVRIVKNKRQMADVREGDILVSPMTTPDFLPAMKKAAAFVTDEGGIMCHAAIVAREMRKPCVIGTKFATQVFKDGDLVEVDANNGIVRILKT